MPINRRRWGRRAALKAALAGAGAVLPRIAVAAPARQTTLIDPYEGSIPLTFPLAEGTYASPIVDNWHAPRDGAAYPWNHRLVGPRRVHDGVDVFPLPDAPLPVAYAPVQGTVAAVCYRPENRLDAPLTYRESGATAPPWDYSRAEDTVSVLPLYGNFVWLMSTDPASAGYFIFSCHLQAEPVLESLMPDQPVTAETPIGVMGDTGNAEGTPQLHVELHYPGDFGFRCQRCRPPVLLTAFNSFASLRDAVPRTLA